MSVLIADAEIDGEAGMGLRVDGPAIVAIGWGLGPEPSDDLIIDASGGALIPGIHDHHVHLGSWAAALSSVRVGPPDVVDRAGFASVIATAKTGIDGWVRAVGYHESVAGPLDATTLDAVAPHQPLRVEHRSGSTWFLNTAGLDRLGQAAQGHPSIERDAHGVPTGRVTRGDRWLASLLGATPPDLAPVGRRAAAFGVTAMTDADPTREQSALRHLEAAVDSKALPQRLTLMGPPGLRLPRHDRLTLGPVKILLDDDDAADVGAVTGLVRSAHAENRGVAIHCVTRFQTVVALTALADAGAPAPQGDRIEHGSVIPAELIDEVKRLGLTVVTQPGFIAERGDQYLTDVEPEDLSELYRCRTLVDAGIPVLLSTDAPYSRPNPWAAIRAASDRRTQAGATIGAAEAIDRRDALRRISAPPLRLGGPADLCLLPEPLDRVLARSGDPAIRVTFSSGALVHNCE